MLLTLSSPGPSQAPRWQEPLCRKRFTSGLQTAELRLPFQPEIETSSQWTGSEFKVWFQAPPCLAQTFPFSFLFFSPDTNSPFVSFAELEYRNSYEIEYMEKIGSSLPVSSASGQRGTCFPSLSCENGGPGLRLSSGPKSRVLRARSVLGAQ